MNDLIKVIRTACAFGAWLLLLGAWLCIGLALYGFVRALIMFGPFRLDAYLDAEVGYYGWFAFGMGSLAVILAVKGCVQHTRKLFQLFNVTLIISLLGLVPMVLASTLFLR